MEPPHRVSAALSVRSTAPATTAIDVLPWDRTFETGIAAIDRQHHGLVDLLNELANRVVHLLPDDDITQILDALLRYAEAHFAAEEMIWAERIGDVTLEKRHRGEHRRFIEEVTRLAGLSKTAGAGEDLLVFLTRWLAKHILQSDRRYAMIAGEIDRGTPRHEAAPIADRRMAENANLLHDTLVGMYGNLAESALKLKRESLAKRRSDAALRRSEALLSAVVDSTSDMIWVVDTDAHALLFFNRAFRDCALLDSDRHAGGPWIPLYARAVEEGPFTLEFEIPESTRTFDLSLNLLRHGGTTYAVSVFARDITQKKSDQDSIRQLAFYDPLTNLPNRRLFQDQLRKAIAHCQRAGQHGAVMFIDLDNFKILNDTRGHPVGDLFLIELAQRITRSLRTEDTVGRIGGDEFAVLLGSLGADDGTAGRYCEIVADKLLSAVAEGFHLGDHDYRTSCSIGICIFNGNSLSPDDILKRADTSMYQAKAAGKNAFRFYDPTYQLQLESRLAIESWLRAALPGQLRLHLQPQVNIDGRIVGAEGLLRWVHPERGMISPADFIPLAEDTGLIVPIGRWVIERACAILQRWEELPEFRDLLLAVNVSAKQFHDPGFVPSIRSCLEQAGAHAGRLKLELTESLLLAETDTVIAKMEELRLLGIQMSLDDFGTGYSSFSVMRTLPLDQLKIDQSFIRNMESDHRDQAVVQTIIALGTTMGLEVIAEGVEAEAQRQFLETHGCRLYQGYLFSKPLTEEDFEKYVCQHAGQVTDAQRR